MIVPMDNLSYDDALDELAILMKFDKYTPTKELNENPFPYKHFLTVGKLKQRLADLPDDTTVLIERVEDVYFEKHGWQTADFHFKGDAGDSKFFQPWSTRIHNGILFIVAHY